MSNKSPAIAVKHHRGIIKEKYLDNLTWISKLSLVILTVIFLAAIFAPIVTPYDPNKVELKQRYSSPTLKHPLGTDALGRDLLTRIVYGARISLLVGFGGVLIAGIVGLSLGVLSGYYGGLIDQILLRVSEIFLAFPAYVLLLALISVMGPNLGNIILIFAVTKWARLYRLVRAKFLSMREEEFVEALRALNIKPVSIMFKHMLSNTLGPVTVWFTIALATSIIQEAGLSFIGLGIQPPTPSLGNLLSAAQDVRVMREYVWMWLFPGVTIAIITLCTNFVGDWLRDVSDPRTQKKGRGPS